MTSASWNVQPGETLIRGDIHRVYGGNPQAGISRSGATPNVIVYSDPAKAGDNGYDFDGWDAREGVFYYTGEGKTGDQKMDRGNRAIADHCADGYALRLFLAIGNKPGSQTRIQRYLGEFEVDLERPYEIRTAPGTDGALRKVFVFRLRPVGPVVTEKVHTRAL
ncbi:hypothetical protein [Mycobacterium sp. GA-1841]|uniref:hypothetical protein n=1 Tax=Mycobacterium sp. GA-1841 TaxID=1834154 RepID=UPI0011156C05|nr:hypothetical protein [Mycobacterium sp. GA-1841]